MDSNANLKLKLLCQAMLYVIRKEKGFSILVFDIYDIVFLLNNICIGVAVLQPTVLVWVALCAVLQRAIFPYIHVISTLSCNLVVFCQYIPTVLMFQRLGYGGVQRLLGFMHTVGTIPEALPPPRSTLLSSFMSPHKPNVRHDE